MRNSILNFLSALVVLVLLAGCASQHPVYRADKVENMQGIYYSLPTTRLIVGIPVAQIVKSPGPFAAHASVFFDTPARTATETTYKLSLSEATVTTKAYADPDQTFVAKVRAGAFQKRAIDLKLNDIGLFTDVTSEFEDKTIEVILKTVENAAKVAAALKAAPPAAFAGPPQEVYDAYNAIVQARAQRNALLGHLPPGPSADYINVILARLDEIEKRNLEKFFGSSTTTAWMAEFEIDPGTTQNPNATHALFEISQDEKTLQLGSYKPLSAPPGSWFQTATSPKDAITLDIQRVPGPSDTVAASYTTEPKRNGFFYRIPAQATVSVLRSGAQKKRVTVAVAQYGHVVALPVSTGSLLKSNYTLSLHPETGTAKQVITGSEPITGELVDQAGAAATEVANYIRLRRELEKQQREERDAERQAIIDRFLALVAPEPT